MQGPSAPPIVAILFDAVGTLIDAAPPVPLAYQSIAATFGSRLTLDQIRQRFRRALHRGGDSQNPASLARSATSEPAERERWREIVAEVIDDVPLAAADDLFAALWRHFAEPASWRLLDGAASTWRALRERGYRLGVASNFDSRLRTVLAGQPPLEDLADSDPSHLFISSEIGFPKPDPRFFRAVEERLQLAPSQILLVGDDWTNDIMGARSAGWSTVWFDRRDFASPEPATRVGQLSELLALLPPRLAP